VKISEKKLHRLIDERVEHYLERQKKTAQNLQKQLDQLHAEIDGFNDAPGSVKRGKRFEEYDD
jgi:hypothetical protein